ncbi:uncharacterized protein N7477_001183 [Penicillium maclennaniae]|uniref:uncharacterized protein n=1 Tax=Penicillium maclennaniae TaxID=1343394 RepID=UPI002541CF39|nr:uncharacterized protein N7477_001183 [Penicillium maclennaniae]KAJ5684838.1 hypothetical protein N7477_001183 [Penicillium maclennaniae]
MSTFDPTHVNLNTASMEDVLCCMEVSSNDYNGHLGGRFSSIFVIFFVSSAFTIFPVVSKRMTRWKVPFSVYIFARHLGTGIIVATAFIHLLDPAYGRIGPKTCVGGLGYWIEYPWCAAIVLIVLAYIVIIFLLDLAVSRDVFSRLGKGLWSIYGV